jgi:hypothetical protein
MSNKPYIVPETTPTNICEPEGVSFVEALPSCSMTLDELKIELCQSVEDAQNGLYITIEQARSRHPRL